MNYWIPGAIYGELNALPQSNANTHTSVLPLFTPLIYAMRLTIRRINAAAQA
jgi:hypothetical protein